MKYISKKIVDFWIKQKMIDDEEYEIYQYGMLVLLEVGCSFITSIIICYIMGRFWDGLIFFATFIPLRSYLGGIHMKKYINCYICSIMVLFMVLWISTFEIESKVLWILYIISVMIIYIEAKKQRGKDNDGKFYFNKICIILVCNNILSIVLFMTGFGAKIFLLACTNGVVILSKILE